MIISYDFVTGVFLQKITEFELLQLAEDDRSEVVDGYLARAIPSFRRVCKYDLTSNDERREFIEDIADEDVDEIVDILSEGMLVQWLKPYVYKQELLESVLNTADFSAYSPAELLLRVGNAYAKAQKDYKTMVTDYGYNHADLKSLHM